MLPTTTTAMASRPTKTRNTVSDRPRGTVVGVYPPPYTVDHNDNNSRENESGGPIRRTGAGTHAGRTVSELEKVLNSERHYSIKSRAETALLEASIRRIIVSGTTPTTTTTTRHNHYHHYHHHNNYRDGQLPTIDVSPPGGQVVSMMSTSASKGVGNGANKRVRVATTASGSLIGHNLWKKGNSIVTKPPSSSSVASPQKGIYYDDGGSGSNSRRLVPSADDEKKLVYRGWCDDDGHHSASCESAQYHNYHHHQETRTANPSGLVSSPTRRRRHPSRCTDDANDESNHTQPTTGGRGDESVDDGGGGGKIIHPHCLSLLAAYEELGKKGNNRSEAGARESFQAAAADFLHKSEQPDYTSNNQIGNPTSSSSSNSRHHSRSTRNDANGDVNDVVALPLPTHKSPSVSLHSRDCRLKLGSDRSAPHPAFQ